MPLSAGEKLGPYEILAPIGVGGMGEVYKACDTRLDRTVAIKVSMEAFSERFEREARAVAALNHPNICTLHDVGPNYLVMEYIEGTPLKGPLPIDQALKYAAQICDALDAAHKKNITHRDLKPANILVTKQGIKLLDFGLAKVGPVVKADEATMTTALTGKGEILGTLMYMSPEQISGQEADARSDIFSFGLVLYEMVTGKRALVPLPFARRNHCSAPPRPVRPTSVWRFIQLLSRRAHRLPGCTGGQCTRGCLRDRVGLSNGGNIAPTTRRCRQSMAASACRMISRSSFPDRELLDLTSGGTSWQNAEQCAQGRAVADSLAQAAARLRKVKHTRERGAVSATAPKRV